MLFGCLPVQNIPAFIAMYGVLAFCVWVIWQDYKDAKRAKGIARVRRCEIHRKARRAIEMGKISRR